MRVRGFSLIELMIVIGVIAIINVVMVPSFTSLQRSAKQVSAKSSARQLMIALEQYYFIHQQYPENEYASIESLIMVLKSENILKSSPINPYSGFAYSSSDESGKLVITPVDDGYKIVGYGHQNQDIIFEFP